jgi:hypothetical protein
MRRIDMFKISYKYNVDAFDGVFFDSEDAAWSYIYAAIGEDAEALLADVSVTPVGRAA